MRTSEQTDIIDEAIALAQAEIENATVNSTNPFYNSKYADLAAILSSVRPAFARHGVGILQSVSTVDAIDPEGKLALYAIVETRLVSKGQWYADDLKCRVLKKKSKKDASDAETEVMPGIPSVQDLGSSLTYLRRYALAAITGVAQEDDDGNAAAAKEGQAGQAPAQKPKTQAPAQKPPAQKAPGQKAPEVNPFAERVNKAKAEIIEISMQKFPDGSMILADEQRATIKKQLVDLGEELKKRHHTAEDAEFLETALIVWRNKRAEAVAERAQPKETPQEAAEPEAVEAEVVPDPTAATLAEEALDVEPPQEELSLY